MLGYGNFWFNQDNINLSYSSFKLKIKRRLQDQYVQNWKANINNDELYYNYRMFKDTFSLENYLVVLTENYAKKCSNLGHLIIDYPYKVADSVALQEVKEPVLNVKPLT